MKQIEMDNRLVYLGFAAGVFITSLVFIIGGAIWDTYKEQCEEFAQVEQKHNAEVLDPKFKWNQDVEITGGFYAGSTGRIVAIAGMYETVLPDKREIVFEPYGEWFYVNVGSYSNRHVAVHQDHLKVIPRKRAEVTQEEIDQGYIEVK